MLKPAKCAFVILVFILTGTTHGQRTFDEHEVLFGDLPKKPNAEAELNRQEMDSLYGMLARSTDYCESENNPSLTFELAKFIEEHEHHITFTRSNDDPYIDVIFDGHSCPGHESGIVELFLGTPDGFKKIFSHWGKIMHHQRSPEGHEIMVHHYPCCAAYTNAYIRLDLSRTSDTVSVSEMRLLASPHTSDGPFFPEVIDRSGAITTIKPAGLRWSPDTVARDWLNDLDNNIVAHYGTGAEGTLLYRQDDGPWGFVLMDTDPIKHILEDEHLPQTSFKIYGWLNLAETTAE